MLNDEDIEIGILQEPSFCKQCIGFFNLLQSAFMAQGLLP